MKQDVYHTEKSPAILSICTGIGGIERGIEIATGCRIQPVLYVERGSFAVQNLVAKMEAGRLAPAPIWSDLSTFDPAPYSDKICGITGGYPCPGESVAGLRMLERDPRWVWPHIERSITAIEPVWCFFENVDGHLSGTFPIILRSLRRMGYAVEAGIYTAAEVGAPHQRARVFILARRYGHGGWGRMADPYGFPNRKPDQSKRGGASTTSEAGETLGHTARGNERRQRKRKTMAQETFGGSGDALANTDSNGQRQVFGTAESENVEGCSRVWPATPGSFQHEWEHPRTLEPGVGYTVDGVRVREDILRALGNAVVSDTAALAWADLTAKMNKNQNLI